MSVGADEAQSELDAVEGRGSRESVGAHAEGSAQMKGRDAEVRTRISSLDNVLVYSYTYIQVCESHRRPHLPPSIGTWPAGSRSTAKSSTRSSAASPRGPSRPATSCPRSGSSPLTSPSTPTRSSAPTGSSRSEASSAPSRASARSSRTLPVKPGDAERQRQLDQLVGSLMARAGSAGFTADDIIDRIKEFLAEQRRQS